MRIGIVCPYAYDVPGGVQFHVRDQAEELRRRGHEVSVFAPVETEYSEDGFINAGKTFAIPYNGSVARLAFGPRVAARTRQWVTTSDFDILHVHEPATPSVSLIALQHARCPVVGTFHAAIEKSLLYTLGKPVVQSVKEKLSAQIAVSEEARRTLQRYQGGDAIVIPNGVDYQAFAQASASPKWQQSEESPVFCFLGRLDEPRKGLAILVEAIPLVLAGYPQARFLIAGPGSASRARATLASFGKNVEFLGTLSEAEKIALFSSATAYIAPQTGGESFGIVLVEAMAANCLVVASSIPAFTAVLEQGRLGKIFTSEDAVSLAEKLLEVCENREAAARLAKRGHQGAKRYDWSAVTDQVLAVYERCREHKLEN
ncbi:glycosyltransferase family 4 protein [Varibaculum massiliense]|uniref:glycosyltransferase family 4 protein n=1 Tax=Varibaculum massiliense TaxID=1852372 RepID=UPI00288C2C7F|nr:glycosyltransferase family 4 protein [Varibaculum massiliense]